MGFRNPPKSAAVSVDTRFDPQGAGVRIYTDNSNAAAPIGVVEFTDGIGDPVDPPARITQHAAANQRAQNASESGGLLLSGGQYAGVTAPALDLAVITPDAGIHIPVATLTGAAGFALGDGYVPKLTAGASVVGTPSQYWQPILRAGTQIVTANAASFASIAWPAMPNGLVTALIVPDYSGAVLGEVQISAYRITGADVRLLSPAGANLANGTSVRVHFLAIGF